MTLPITGVTPPGDTRRGLHDRLEAAYLRLSRSSRRFFEARTRHATFTGFAGLDAATMNRVLHVDAGDAAGVSAMLRDADAFFRARRVPWSVQLTPYAAPADLPRLLLNAGFHASSVLGVMTWHADAAPATDHTPPAGDVRVTEVDARDAGEMSTFTRVVLDAFGMPERYAPAVKDVNTAWAATGRVFIAHRRGAVAGVALLTRAGDGVHGAYNVCTRRGHRRHGVATALTRALVHAFREDPNGDVLTLQVARGSTAERLYRRLGFRHRYDWTLYVPT